MSRNKHSPLPTLEQIVSVRQLLTSRLFDPAAVARWTEVRLDAVFRIRSTLPPERETPLPNPKKQAAELLQRICANL